MVQVHFGKPRKPRPRKLQEVPKTRQEKLAPEREKRERKLLEVPRTKQLKIEEAIIVKKCANCGREMNSSWRKLCFSCYHKQKGDYDPKKLQKRFGGSKKDGKR